ncbi:MAG: transglutaminase domain-containing protein [bacterium]|nr:transglutaminase domain-containing protein [bacterium]
MISKVKELISGSNSRLDKISKLFYWVARNVRYLGVDGEKIRPGLEPHDVSYTFDTKGGVCRDKAALLTAMLRIAGIKSDVILISAGSRLNPEAPVPWFNHAICVAYDEKGIPNLFLDPTDEKTKDFLPKYEEDSSFLIASKKGHSLQTTPVSPPSKNNCSLNINLKLDVSGNAKGSLVYLFKGLADNAVRTQRARLSRHQMESGISALVKLLHPNTDLIDFTCTNPDDVKNDMSITANVEIKNYAAVINHTAFIPFDAVDLQLHFLYNYFTAPFKLSKRERDFKLPGAFSFDTLYEVELSWSGGLKSASIPVVKPFESDGMKSTLNSTSSNNKLSVNYHFENSRIHYKKEAFPALKKNLMKFLTNENLYIIAKTGGDSK